MVLYPGHFVDRINLSQDGIALALRIPGGASDDLTVTSFHPMQIRRRGEEMRLVIEGPGPTTRPVDAPLLKAIARGHRWFNELVTGQIETVNAIAARDGITRRYVSRLIRLALLAPEIVEAIVRGQQPVELMAETLTYAELPVEWAEQKAFLGFR